MRKVAVTGGLASGKTEVCHILAACGAYVVSADEIVHLLLSPTTSVGRQVIQLLGSEIVDGQVLDRKKIAEKVFSHPKILEALERIIHPAVSDEIKKRYQAIKDTTQYSLFVAEVPLLYESESHKFYDAVIAVIADQHTCTQRFQSRTGHSSEEFDQRMARQMSPMHKAALATHAIHNNGSLEELKKQTISIYHQVL